MATTRDVIIIGGGAAGLAAAHALARARRSVLLVEARDRVGGRIWSHEEPGLPVCVELGAEFIHGRAEATFSLLEKAACAAIDAGGERWTLRDGKLGPSDDLFSGIQRAMRRNPVLRRKDMPFDAFIERHLRKELSPEACAYARMFAQGFDAADTKRASARALAEEWTSGSVNAGHFRPMGGYGVLLSALTGSLRGSAVDVQLNTVVRTVRWSRGSVRIEGAALGRDFEMRAKKAIVTLPLGVLQLSARTPGAVRFAPALTPKRDALRHLAAGPVIKVLLRFRHAFWEELERGRYRNTAFFHPRQAPFPTFWTALPVRTPLLVAWAAGPKAQRLARAGKPAIIDAALESLATLFGERSVGENALESAWLHDWQTDPYARGAYSYVLTDGGKARAELARALQNTLFFAGEATDTDGEAGTVAGALQSGERAARQVLASFRR